MIGHTTRNSSRRSTRNWRLISRRWRRRFTGPITSRAKPPLTVRHKRCQRTVPRRQWLRRQKQLGRPDRIERKHADIRDPIENRDLERKRRRRETEEHQKGHEA